MHYVYTISRLSNFRLCWYNCISTHNVDVMALFHNSTIYYISWTKAYSFIVNLFQAEINGLKWCKYTGAPCTLDRPLDDPVLVSFANALESNVLCSWRHSPSCTTQRLNQGLTCSESAKELWLFWYGDDPRTINIVDSSLKGWSGSSVITVLHFLGLAEAFSGILHNCFWLGLNSFK